MKRSLAGCLRHIADVFWPQQAQVYVVQIIAAPQTATPTAVGEVAQSLADTSITSATSASFVSNLWELNARGFPHLSQALLEQGDPDAQIIAAQAVKWSDRHLALLQDGESVVKATDTTP